MSVRRSKTDVLPLCHAMLCRVRRNQAVICVLGCWCWQFTRARRGSETTVEHTLRCCRQVRISTPASAIRRTTTPAAVSTYRRLSFFTPVFCKKVNLGCRQSTHTDSNSAKQSPRKTTSLCFSLGVVVRPKCSLVSPAMGHWGTCPPGVRACTPIWQFMLHRSPVGSGREW